MRLNWFTVQVYLYSASAAHLLGGSLHDICLLELALFLSVVYAGLTGDSSALGTRTSYTEIGIRYKYAAGGKVGGCSSSNTRFLYSGFRGRGH